MLKKIFRFLFGDVTVLYTVLIMMSIMYHYRSSLVFVYGAVTLVLTVLIFKLFDYIDRHRRIGTAAYCALFVIFIRLSRYFIIRGTDEYPLSFGVWFLTPQDVLKYSVWYTLAIYMLFMIFMTSVIYYFTKVRYRIFMNFLIFFIPFAIYGKEYEKMPTVFIMLLAVGYIAIMIKYHRLAGSNTVIVDRKKIIASSVVYVVLFAAAAAVVPKPDIKENREILETMIAAEQFTDRLNAMLNVFRDTSTGEQFRAMNNDSIIYFVRAENAMRIKTATFTDYDYKKDAWTPVREDYYFENTFDEPPVEFEQPESLFKAVCMAAEADSEFAEKYSLENVDPDMLYIPETSEMTIYSVSQQASVAPCPDLPKTLTGLSSDGSHIGVSYTGVLYKANKSESYFSPDETFSYEYYTSSFIDSFNNRELMSGISALDNSDYNNMLEDAALILEDIDYDESLRVQQELDSMNYIMDCLDYGRSEKIKQLADEITSDLSTDIEKAKALESYFRLNNYVYDDSYSKANGDNAEDFIFDAKRGVCYEYATAMVLLARAAGIPARYAEGYNMYETYPNGQINTNFVIRSRSAHGFPELYIKGEGWVSFEPTVYREGNFQQDNNAGRKLSYAGIYLIAAALLFLIVWKLSPAVIHRLFLIKIKHTAPDRAVVLIMRRICRLCKFRSVITSHEAAEKISTLMSVDISFTAVLFDKAAYGGGGITEDEKNKSLSDYMTVREAQRAQKSWKQRYMRKHQKI